MTNQQDQAVDIDELAKKKVLMIETQLDSCRDCKPDEFKTWFSTLKQIITAADLHRTNDKSDKPNDAKPNQEMGESIYADYSDDNEQFNAIDLTEQFATNSVKWTIRVQAFKLLHRLVLIFIGAKSKLSVLGNLPDLIRLSFVAATSPYDDLKMQGFEMFKSLIELFASVEEREFPGQSILEQYKTQVLSAIKPAFNLDAPPYITAKASQVCSLWICKGLEKESGDLRRTYQLMLLSIEKLEHQSVNQNSKLYTESELEQERVDILGSWALLFITSQKLDHTNSAPISCFELLRDLVKPQISAIIDRWWEALKDYALLIMPAPRLIGTSRGNNHVYTKEVALKLFEPNWHRLLLASTIWLCGEYSMSSNGIQDKTSNTEAKVDYCPSECDNSSPGQERIGETAKYCCFIFGIIMKELCRRLIDTNRSILPESTLFAVRSLQMLANNDATKLVFCSNLEVAQEFYLSLYELTISYCRDSNRAILRSALDLTFELILGKIRNQKMNVQYGVARLVLVLLEIVEEIDSALKQKLPDSSSKSMHLTVRLHNLMLLIKTEPEHTLSEASLRRATVVVFRRILGLDLSPAVRLSIVEQLTDLLPDTYRSDFAEILGADMRERLESALQIQKRAHAKNETKSQPIKSAVVATRPAPRPQVAKITLKADFSNFVMSKK